MLGFLTTSEDHVLCGYHYGECMQNQFISDDQSLRSSVVLTISMRLHEREWGMLSLKLRHCHRPNERGARRRSIGTREFATCDDTERWKVDLSPDYINV